VPKVKCRTVRRSSVTGRCITKGAANDTRAPQKRSTSASAAEDAERSRALAVLAHAIERCRFRYANAPEVFSALDLLSAGASAAWPFAQFGDSLGFAVNDEFHAEGRWQNVHASLNAIRRALVR